MSSHLELCHNPIMWVDFADEGTSPVQFGRSLAADALAPLFPEAANAAGWGLEETSSKTHSVKVKPGLPHCRNVWRTWKIMRDTENPTQREQYSFLDVLSQRLILKIVQC